MNRPEAVAVAMSGGVDSTVAAYLALTRGHEVTGIHLQLDDAPPDAALAASCAKLGIRLLECDCRAEFQEKVIVPAAREYARGRTPNPCCECNKVLKFAELLRAAGEIGIRRVFTGHYVNLERGADGKFFLRRAADSGKDQSYFLYRLTQHELSGVGFPLGGLTKSEVRRLAASAGLPCASRPDSQDACFQIPGECCGDTLSRRGGIAGPGGRFLYRGREVGRHDGIHRYTIGQRQGLRVALGVPAYIAAIDAASGDITLTAEADELLASEFTVTRPTWCRGEAPPPETPLTVRVRYRSPGVPCRMVPADGTTLRVIPSAPLRAVTPGQAAVFYSGDVLLGGGVIDRGVGGGA
ncbi:MAG: tRNA 2-thiouridine(34) synthase MnmA [Lentisphaeria bacterium]|nr:tRNA 2-thiouridine(34) synthase MnmA [Lentisphaeria bacterium]